MKYTEWILGRKFSSLLFWFDFANIILQRQMALVTKKTKRRNLKLLKPRILSTGIIQQQNVMQLWKKKEWGLCGFIRKDVHDAFLSKKCKWQNNMNSMFSFLWKQTFTKYWYILIKFYKMSQKDMEVCTSNF